VKGQIELNTEVSILRIRDDLVTELIRQLRAVVWISASPQLVPIAWKSYLEPPSNSEAAPARLVDNLVNSDSHTWTCLCVHMADPLSLCYPISVLLNSLPRSTRRQRLCHTLTEWLRGSLRDISQSAAQIRLVLLPEEVYSEVLH
jgi:hypothetical protein